MEEPQYPKYIKEMFMSGKPMTLESIELANECFLDTDHAINFIGEFVPPYLSDF